MKTNDAIRKESPIPGYYWYDDNHKLHRDGAPACVFDNGGTQWYWHGMRHRTDGPAIEVQDTTRWYQYDKLHRVDGPAIVAVGGESWYYNDKLHRLDGPALSWALLNNTPVYAVNGKRYFSVADYNRAVANWLSYKEVTREEIKQQIGHFRIVE